MLDNRVEQRTVAQGLAPYTLDQVVSGRRSFATVFAHNDLVRYTVESTDGALFEINEGVLDTGFVPPRLSRARLIASTTGSAIDWPDSTPKRIFCDADAELFGPLSGQLTLATLDGTSTVDAIVAETAIKTPVLKDGMCIEVDLAGANTVTNPTLKLNALAPKTIVLPSGGAVPIGYLRAMRTRFCYDAGGDQWQVLRPHEIASQALADGGVDDHDFITALKMWTAPMRGGWKNIVGANGGFEVWQRFAGGAAAFGVAASSVAYGPDRWYLGTTANQVSTMAQQPGLADSSRFSAFIRRDAGQTGTGGMNFGFPLDLDEIIPLRGKKLNMRFVAKAGPNWSPALGNIRAIVAFGAGAVQKRVVGGGFTGQVNVIDKIFALAPGGAAVNFETGLSTIPVPTNATQGEVLFYWEPTGTAGATDFVLLDDVDVRVEEPVIAYFERRPFDDELRACLRHFWKTFPYNVAPAQNLGASHGAIAWRSVAGGSVATWSPRLPFPVPMRVSPTATLFNPGAANSQVRNTTDNADCSASGVSTDANQFLVGTTTSAGTAVNEQLQVDATFDAGI